MGFWSSERIENSWVQLETHGRLRARRLEVVLEPARLELHVTDAIVETPLDAFPTFEAGNATFRIRPLAESNDSAVLSISAELSSEFYSIIKRCLSPYRFDDKMVCSEVTVFYGAPFGKASNIFAYVSIQSLGHFIIHANFDYTTISNEVSLEFSDDPEFYLISNRTRYKTIVWRDLPENRPLFEFPHTDAAQAASNYQRALEV